MIVERLDQDLLQLVEDNYELAERVARRYSIGGVGDPDLVQVAVLGLIGAAQRYDPAIGPFAPYAIATIHGEVKKHFRAHGWTVRVPRSLQEASITVAQAVAELEQQLGRSPSPTEVGRHVGMETERVLAALRVRHARFPSDLTDADRSTGAQTERVVDRVDLARAVDELPPEDAELLSLRFEEELTQRQMATRLGTSQAQIHRRLASTLARLRSTLNREGGAGS